MLWQTESSFLLIRPLWMFTFIQVCECVCVCHKDVCLQHTCLHMSRGSPVTDFSSNRRWQVLCKTVSLLPCKAIQWEGAVEAYTHSTLLMSRCGLIITYLTVYLPRLYSTFHIHSSSWWSYQCREPNVSSRVFKCQGYSGRTSTAWPLKILFFFNLRPIFWSLRGWNFTKFIVYIHHLIAL